MSHCWHLYDIFMTHVWHVSDTFLTSFWHDFKTFHQIVSDLILTNVDFLTRLWHVSDIIMTRLCHVYDIFMTRFWHLPFWSENEWNSILIRKRLGMRQLLFDYSGLRKYYTSGFHFRFPLPVVVFIADLPVDRQALYCLCPKTLLGEQNSICILEKKAANLLSAIFLSFPSGFRLPVSGFRLPALAKLVNFCSFWYSSIKILEFDK